MRRIRNCTLLSCFLLFALTTQAQEEEDYSEEVNFATWPYIQTLEKMDSLDIANPISYWNKQNRFAADLSEVSYTNWSAGGSNTVSFLFNVELKRTYEKGNVRWQNEFIGKYGLNAEKGRKLRKTDDQLEINSTYGYRTASLSNWFYSVKTQFKSQFDRGYNYPDRQQPISSFMAPGYLFFGVGAEYGKDSDTFTLYLSPATLKTTFVLDQRLADEGAYGVDEAVYDSHGTRIRSGKNSRTEFGVLLSSEYNTEIAKNISLSNRLTLYTDYLADFGNVDVDWKVDFTFKVNSFMAAKLGSHLLFDDNTKTKQIDANGLEYTSGAKVQWKQQIGIGLLIEI